MRKVEKEEERSALQDSEKQCFHLCIINLVIGTLYCAKGNYEFGISRIIKSLEPYSKKLERDTWWYAKRCFLAVSQQGGGVRADTWWCAKRCFLAVSQQGGGGPGWHVVVRQALLPGGESAGEGGSGLTCGGAPSAASWR